MQSSLVTRPATATCRRNANASIRPASGQVSLRRCHIAQASKKQAGRWKGMDEDVSDDQQDITRGRNMVESVFQGAGGMGGTHNAILSSTDYISQAKTSFNNIEDGYYIAPGFLDKIAVHVAKNFMDLPKIKVPLILGIWGGKGQGKTFQCALAFKKLGIQPIVMSAGELESGNAGEPAKLIRQRYREASDIIKKGRMCALFINDLDAGAGRFGLTTQYTVNNQMVNATLMNIADNPTNVQLPGVYKNESIPRVPIIVTGNDFSTLYAPLIRDGRMEKFYWNPTREDRIGVCMGIFAHDGITRVDVERLVDSFPGQSIDFFGALRSRVYDDRVRAFVKEQGVENIGKRLINNREGKVKFEGVAMTLDILMAYGRDLVQEQENVKRVQLADAYLAGAELAGASGSSLPENYEGLQGELKRDEVKKSFGRAPAQRSPSPPPPPPAPPARAASPPARTLDEAKLKLEKQYNLPSTSNAPSTPTRSAGGVLSQSQLEELKIDELMEVARKVGVALPRSPVKGDVVRGLLAKGVTEDQLSREGRLRVSPARFAVPPASSSSTSSSSSRGSSWRDTAPASGHATAAPKFSSPSRFSSPPRYGSPAVGGTGSPLCESDLNSLKADDLTSLARRKGVSAGRNPTKGDLVHALLKAGVTTADCSKHMLTVMQL